MIIAIDGPAGVGKSSIASMISEKLNLYYLNSGSFYRACALRMIKNGLNTKSHEDRVKSTNDAKIEINNGRIFLDGEDVQDFIRTPEIDFASSDISCDPEVRMCVNDKIEHITKSLDIVCEGRDMTTVVFPNADYKFYFDAKPEVRAKRRFYQNSCGQTYEQILEDIKKRDENDKSKSFGALKIADDAVYIDTSDLTINEVCEKVLNAVKAHKI